MIVLKNFYKRIVKEIRKKTSKKHFVFLPANYKTKNLLLMI